MKTKAFDVYLDDKMIDTVWFTGYTAEEVKSSLVSHDGYDPGIEVAEITGPKDDRPDPLETPIEDLLLYEAQNNQMVDSGYTYCGALMLRAAAEIAKLRGQSDHLT